MGYGDSCEEAAEVCGCPVETIKSRVSLARRATARRRIAIPKQRPRYVRILPGERREIARLRANDRKRLAEFTDEQIVRILRNAAASDQRLHDRIIAGAAKCQV